MQQHMNPHKDCTAHARMSKTAHAAFSVAGGTVFSQNYPIARTEEYNFCPHNFEFTLKLATGYENRPVIVGIACGIFQVGMSLTY